jgi:hypothetical protein
MKNFSKICIIHFQPLEKYPPITNLLNYLAENIDNLEITIFSTKNNLGLPQYRNRKIKIIRYQGINEKTPSFVRLFHYLKFYLGCLMQLLVKQPDQVLYFETLSSFPAIIYYYLNSKRVKLLIHYHEYSTPKEYQNGMFLGKWFHRLEQKIYSKVSWLSHTNQQRMDMFLNDCQTVNRKSTHLLPNYPPQSWSKNIKIKTSIPDILRIVYVGSTGLETLYFKEIFAWVQQQNGNVLLDIYSFSIPNDFIIYLEKMNCPFIQLKGKLNYNDFPRIATDYHVGVILYKGHIPNNIYIAPNKLFEYLVCGLDVWYPELMIGISPYINTTTSPRVIPVNFEDISDQILLQYKHKNEKTVNNNFSAEQAYEPLSNFLLS